ncbi:gluconokinase [Loktanella sp. F6476L]|uniref:gluconokinase n=1 Tax=Loktanella sp. F6476L TaxID=2926405 RepID=UPI001FF4907E|nr:gluconokinase [Loktanella sp. F6476L]MCK0119049.1 gluconokinase [Loktanella sp. F6476L]
MFYVVMGVSGCGKSSIGAAFADAIGGVFVDGDDLHPVTNVAKMAAGTPLNDADRAPWLRDVGAAFREHEGEVVIGCSALKRAYRDIIRDAAGGPVAFLHLHGSQAVIAERMATRADHFMPTALLDSQFAALEMPDTDETAITVDIDQPPAAIVAAFVAKTGKDFA